MIVTMKRFREMQKELGSDMEGTLGGYISGLQKNNQELYDYWRALAHGLAEADAFFAKHEEQKGRLFAQGIFVLTLLGVHVDGIVALTEKQITDGNTKYLASSRFDESAEIASLRALRSAEPILVDFILTYFNDQKDEEDMNEQAHGIIFRFLIGLAQIVLDTFN